MRFLVVSDREYKKTSRGIDIITSYLAENDHIVDHMVFFKRKKYQDKQISDKIHQLYLYDSLKFYRSRLQFLFPSFALLAYFKHIIRKSAILDFSKYDYVILESGHPIYLASEITNKIIYRQSDPINITFNSNRRFYKNLEKEVIKKASYVFSALERKYYCRDYIYKYSFWHSGFVPLELKMDHNDNNSIVIMGGELDWRLTNAIAKKYPKYHFNVVGMVGISRIGIQHKNITINGYLDYNNYQNMISSAMIVIIPFSKNYVNLLRQVFFTAKILLSMYIGVPILLRAYGSIQTTDQNKKLFVYSTQKEAIKLLDEIISKIENGELKRTVLKDTQDFLSPQIVEKRIKELDSVFLHILNWT